MSNAACADRRHLRNRKPSREQLEAELKAMAERVTILEHAINNPHQLKVRKRVDNAWYTWKAYRLEGAAGGYVICTYKTYGEPEYTLYEKRLDDLIAKAVRLGLHTEWQAAEYAAVRECEHEREARVQGGR